MWRKFFGDYFLMLFYVNVEKDVWIEEIGSSLEKGVGGISVS